LRLNITIIIAAYQTGQSSFFLLYRPMTRAESPNPRMPMIRSTVTLYPKIMTFSPRSKKFTGILVSRSATKNLSGFHTSGR
jgi:hypothetical protein